MPTVVQFRRGTSDQNNNFLGSSGEISVNTTTNSIRVHNGSQSGGFELARSDLSNLTSYSFNSVSIGNTLVISNNRQLQNISGIDTTTINVFKSELVNNISSTISVNTSGIITASNFSGSGSGLTGIPAGQLTGALPALDGSALTGIGGGGGSSSIVVSVNNSPIGTANTINFTNNFSSSFGAGIATIGISSLTTMLLSGLIISGIATAGTSIKILDSNTLLLGNSGDSSISYNGSTNNLILDLNTDCENFVISSSASPKFTFNKINGRLGIGTNIPNYPLDVVGDINSTNTISASNFDSTSDISLKMNIVKIDKALDLISKIDGVRFDWISDGKSSMGVIAQNIQSVTPELVSIGEIKKVNYNGIIAILIESVKELKEEVGYLRNKIL